MAKLAQTSVKYLIKAKFKASGYVERPDVIGAIFGQTEGLLGPDLDLRELQRTGRMGRIEVDITYDKGKSEGTITIPTSLDVAETVLIAAALETIERIGPCNANIKVVYVEDLRTVKRKYIVDRAKELLQQVLAQLPEPSQITEDLMQSVRANEITEYRGLPAGPAVVESDKIIVVEGRADVINLLKHGIRNVIALEGTSVPQTIIDLSKEKEVTVLLDGDRGGDLILKELLQKADIDYVARAPRGKEVEELTRKELYKCLREAVPVEGIGGQQGTQYLSEVKGSFTADGIDKKRENTQKFNEKEQTLSVGVREERKHTKPKHIRTGEKKEEDQSSMEKKNISIRMEKIEETHPEIKDIFKRELEDLVGTRAASIFNEKLEFIGRVPLKELEKALTQVENARAVVVDADITDEILRAASKGISILVGREVKTKRKSSITVLGQNDLE